MSGEKHVNFQLQFPISKLCWLRCGSRGEHRSYPGCAGPRRRWRRRAQAVRDCREDHRSRQSARGQPRRRFPRSRGHGLSASELCCGRIDAFLSSTCCTATADRRCVYGSPGHAGESSDELAAAQGFSSAIVVTPNAFTLRQGSMCSNSPTIGDWERFIAEDLVFLHGYSLPDPGQSNEPWVGRSFNGRLWRVAYRDEAARCLHQPLPHEFLLPHREPQSESGSNGGIRSDQDARAGRRSVTAAAGPR